MTSAYFQRGNSSMGLSTAGPGLGRRSIQERIRRIVAGGKKPAQAALIVPLGRTALIDCFCTRMRTLSAISMVT